MFRFIQSRLIVQFMTLFAVVAWAAYMLVTSTIMVQPPFQLNFWRCMLPLQQSYAAMCILLVLFLLLQTLLTDIYFFRGGFGDSHHLMVALWYLLLLCCGGFVSEFSPVCLSNLVLAMMITLNFDYDRGNLKNKDLVSGMLTGIASLFYPPMVFVAFFVIASLVINRFSKYKDIVVYLLGILTVYLYVFCYFFFSDSLPELTAMLSGLRFYNTFAVTTVYSWREIVLLSAAVLSLLYAVFILKIHYGNKPLLLRKRLLTIHLITITTLLLMVFSPFDIHQAMGFMLIPFTLYYAMLSQMKEHPVVNDVMMLIFAVALCL
ncbi:MAG: hypothetical protein J5644_06850 [Bacteroidales bacterium]|nr:hypothetical protein [Bacteroidales bacterium]